MNVTTLAITPEEAAHKARIYGSIPAAKRTPEDEYLQRVYEAAGKGQRLLDVARAFRETELDEVGRPALALARADYAAVYFHPRRTLEYLTFGSGVGAGGFSPNPAWDRRATRMNIAVPAGTFDDKRLTRAVLRSPVPHLPPEIRPRGKLSDYYILFEADWMVYPVDPFLLRRVAGMLFVVEAEWQLTELEATLLGMMQQT